ncbi:MAG: hypothetical protein KatS3mg077_0471 [Candidatus Binatia bacterium]|nr:MAG: hypothetical protein KatS3mg077_0471 [Candidatus Binatia bacterium]
MGALTQRCPKPLLVVGSRPILEHILVGIRASGIERAVIVVGYLGEQVVDYFDTGERLGLKLDYVWQTEPRGTAEALLLAHPLVREPFLLSWGDVLVSPDNYLELRKAFSRNPAAAWIAVNQVADPCAGAAVYLDAGRRVQRIVEKPAPGTSTTYWNNAGIGIYTPLIFHYAAAIPISPRGERELPQALDQMIAAGEPVYAMPIRGFWSDLGTPEALAIARQHFADSSA